MTGTCRFTVAVLIVVPALILLLAGSLPAAESGDGKTGGDKTAPGDDKSGKTGGDKPAAPGGQEKPAAPGGSQPPASPGKDGDKDVKPAPGGPQPSGKTADPKKPEPKAPLPDPADPEQEWAEPPEPKVPDLTEAPPGTVPEDWRSWATGQDVTSLRRFGIHLYGGITVLLEPDRMAGTGTDAPTYDEMFGETGPAFGLGLSFALMPFISLGFDFNFSELSNGEFIKNEGTPSRTEYYSDTLGVFQFLFNAKIRIPLFLWNLKSGHFRFSRADEVTGLVLYFKGGLGPAILTEMWLEIHPNSPAPIQNQLYYEQTVNFSKSFGLGLEARWSWGGISVEIMVHNLGKPASAWPPNSDSDILMIFNSRLGLAIYF